VRRIVVGYRSTVFVKERHAEVEERFVNGGTVLRDQLDGSINELFSAGRTSAKPSY
jgi:hypothetical protein